MSTHPTIRHYIGEVGRGACGTPTGLQQGGEPSNGEEPSTEWEQEHVATTAGGLFSAYARFGAASICRPCILLAAELLDEISPSSVPEWAKDDDTRSAKLAGTWPPEPELDWPDNPAPF